MPETTVVHAPYNFVPFSDKVLLRYTAPGELPHHDVLDPALKSGEIHVTMTADTPVFVSDGKKHFFRTPSGKYALPGSTIRGMVRANMQILGFGLIRPDLDIMDHQIFYRVVAGKNNTVTKVLKDYYNKSVMDVVSRPASNGKKPFAYPRNVSIGYLHKSGAEYVIIPASGPFLRVSRQHPDVLRYGNMETGTYSVAYRATGKRVTALRFTDRPENGMSRGTLLCTGRPVSKNCLYLFPAPDRSKAPIRIPKEDLTSYKEDFENRRNALKHASFWDLPKAGFDKPVFYTRYQGHIYFGMSLFLRIGHKHFMSEGLPEAHRTLSKRPAALDYPYSILGYAERKNSYRSRVSFSDFEAVGAVREGEPLETILGQPKPSYFPGYVVDGKSYSEDGFLLRGHKQYWLKDVGTLQACTDNVKSTLRPLPAGTSFQGTIRFKNLHEDELGLLLWCLRLEAGCYQSIGMGKPYGFGRMKLCIDQLQEHDTDRLYSPDGLCGAFCSQTGRINQYISCYQAYAAQALSLKNSTLPECDEIQDFIYMRSQVRSAADTGYMTLTEHTSSREPLPTVAAFRKNQSGGEPASDELVAQLAAKFNRK